MNSVEYQITIKSANQKVDDYVLDCKSTWTVQRLKQHISETHLNKPNIEDQRLIYAGNLLKDTLTLKQVFFRDSLCTELTNSNKTDFTIHLVCSTQLQKASTSQNDSNTKGLKKNTRAPQAPSLLNLGQQRPTTSASPNQSATTSHQSSATAVSSSNVTQPNVTQANIGTSSHAAEVAMNLLQSDHMRQQIAIFQQLANMVAAQLVQNLANGLIISPNQSLPISDQAIQSPDIIPLLNVQTLNLQTLTTTTATTTVSTQSDSHLSASSVVSQMLYVGNRQSNDFVRIGESTEATLTGIPQNEQNLNGNQANEREVVINRQPDNTILGLGVQAPQAGVAAAAAVAQPPPQAPIIEQPAAPQAVDPDVPIIQHDVIDWVYYLIKAMILMAALYIHASIFRLLFLVVLLAIAYFFNRRTARRGAQNQQQDPLAGNNVPQERPAVVQQEGAGMERGPGRAAAENDDPLGGRQDRERELRRRLAAPNADAVEEPVNDATRDENQREGDTRQLQNVAQRPISFLKLCYLVVTDFLASLVPE